MNSPRKARLKRPSLLGKPVAAGNEKKAGALERAGLAINNEIASCPNYCSIAVMLRLGTCPTEIRATSFIVLTSTALTRFEPAQAT